MRFNERRFFDRCDVVKRTAMELKEIRDRQAISLAQAGTLISSPKELMTYRKTERKRDIESRWAVLTGK